MILNPCVTKFLLFVLDISDLIFGPYLFFYFHCAVILAIMVEPLRLFTTDISFLFGSFPGMQW